MVVVQQGRNQVEDLLALRIHKRQRAIDTLLVQIV